MKALLDTHTFLWWIDEDERLSPPAKAVIEDGDNEVFFSSASAWELVIKSALGKVEFLEPPEVLIPREVNINGFQVLPVFLRHALKLLDLPDLHRDPFDRILVAQALVEGLSVLSGDTLLRQYPVPTEW